MMNKDKRDLLKMLAGDIIGIDALHNVSPMLVDSILSWILEDRIHQRRLLLERNVKDAKDEKRSTAMRRAYHRRAVRENNE